MAGVVCITPATDIGRERSRRNRCGTDKNERSEKDKKDFRLRDDSGKRSEDTSAKKDLESGEEAKGSIFWYRSSSKLWDGEVN